MKYFLFLLSNLTFITIAHSQVRMVNGNTTKFVSTKQPYDPYVIVDSFTTDLNHMVIQTNSIKDLKILNKKDAVNVYGDKGKNGAVVITTKPNTTLLQLNQLLDKYNVAQTDRNLRVCIDKTLVNKPELILVDETMITTVEITKERRWINAEDANSTERVINIKTNNKKNSL